MRAGSVLTVSRRAYVSVVICVVGHFGFSMISHNYMENKVLLAANDFKKVTEEAKREMVRGIAAGASPEDTNADALLDSVKAKLAVFTEEADRAESLFRVIGFPTYPIWTSIAKAFVDLPSKAGTITEDEKAVRMRVVYWLRYGTNSVLLGVLGILVIRFATTLRRRHDSRRGGEVRASEG